MIKLSQYQQDFSHFIRKNGKKKYHLAHLPQKNAKIYAELIFNNINSCVRVCFPICYAMSKDSYWDDLIHTFIEEFKCYSPMFKDLPEQFLQWLKVTKNPQIKQVIPKFFYCFAHYEWIEMAIAVALDNKQPFHVIQQKEDFLNQDIVLTDSWTIVDYYYDVHLINKKYQPVLKKKTANYYLVFRDIKDNVKFMILTPSSVSLISALVNNQLNFKHTIHTILQMQPELAPDLIQESLTNLLYELYNQGMVLGIK